MELVIDANVLAALVTDREGSGVIRHHLVRWTAAGATLHAPILMRYEVASALTRAAAREGVPRIDVAQAWRRISAVPVTEHALDDGPAVISVARQLGRKSAYDAAYVTLAQRLNAQLWTLDGPLARNATAHGLPVRLVPLRR